MAYISSNLKFLRKEHGLTQEQFANKVGVNRPAVGAYEESRAEPKLSTLCRIAEVFNVSIDVLVNVDLANRTEIDERHPDVDIQAKRLRVLSVTVDNEENEYVDLVPQKASAGYTNGYADPEYLQELPKIYLPMLKSGTHRAFEIHGDSMLPVVPGSIIVGQFVENWNHIKSGKTYVVLTHSEGMVYKRVDNKIYENGVLKLISDNQEYDAYEVPIEDVIEVWEAEMLISSNFPEPDNSSLGINQLSKLVMDLQKEVIKLKGKVD